MSADVATDDVMVREAPRWVRRLTGGVVLLVAVIAFIGSYFHMVEVGQSVGEGWLSYLTPLVVDGLAIAASMVMLVRKRGGQKVGALARLTQVLALAVSMAANFAAAEPTPGARAWALIPPAFLFLAYELLLQQVRVVETTDAPLEAPEEPQERYPAPEVRQVPHSAPVAAYTSHLTPPAGELTEHTGPAAEHGPPVPAAEPTTVDAPRPAPKRNARPSPIATATVKTTDPPTDVERRLWRQLRDELGREPGGPALRDAAQKAELDMPTRRAQHLAALGKETPL